jgi:hypothetical protein
MKTFCGIDNGVTGTIGIIKEDSIFVKTPVKLEQSYTKKKQNISRIKVHELKKILDVGIDFALIERPFTDPKKFKATLSAMRSLEATLIIVELLKIPYAYIDSKEWQKALLPAGVKGSVDLKKASLDVGCRLFPMHSEAIVKHGDADGILIAEYCRRTYK